jgi:RNA polymerase sigma-70 factor (ECF subfamily)
VDQNELCRLVEEHYDRLFRAARLMCGSAQAAEDLVQDSFLAAAESLGRFKGHSSTYTWLYGILLNKFRRWLRRKGRAPLSLQAIAGEEARRPPEEVLQADSPGPPQRAEAAEATELVRRAVEELDPDHRAVITLRYLEGMSYGEIARALGCPVGTVKSRIHYALEKIGHRVKHRIGPAP